MVQFFGVAQQDVGGGWLVGELVGFVLLECKDVISTELGTILNFTSVVGWLVGLENFNFDEDFAGSI